nr:hypothetical protein [Tanacetum cinerariifolium]
IAAKTLKDVLNVGKSNVMDKGKSMTDDDGFTIVDIPVNNPFNILSNKGENVKDLGDINVNEEFESKVWPDLKEEVDILLETGIYPSKQDDEGDVDSDDEGISVDMKPEVDVNAVDNMEINAAFNNDISDGV